VFTNNILSIITWLPIAGGILILGLFKKDQSSAIKKFATAWLALDFIASLWLLTYNRGLGGMQFLEDRPWIQAIGARYQLGVDGVSVLLIVLTTFLGVLAALSSWNYIQKREKEYYILLLILQAMVLGVFSSMDLFLFYLFFEVSLVPMYFHRHLGRREPALRRDQVFPLHVGWFRGYAARRFEDVFSDAGHCADRQDNAGHHRFAGGKSPSGRPGLSHGSGGSSKRNRDLQYRLSASRRIRGSDGNFAGFAVLCFCARICDQSSHVAIPHLAARRAR